MRLTPTEQRIADILSDGSRHDIRDIMRILDMSSLTIRVHISAIRQKIKELGFNIAYISEDGHGYYAYSRRVSIKSE